MSADMYACAPEEGLSQGPSQEVEFRPVEVTDLPLLTGWLAEPHVRAFYQRVPVTLEDVELKYGPYIRREEPTLCHLALSWGVPFAYLQCRRREDYAEHQGVVDLIGLEGGVGVDMFIGEPAYLGLGFGRPALAGYLRQVALPFHPRETRAYIAHDSLNVAALQCAEAVGFRPVGVFVQDGVEMILSAKERFPCTKEST
jgi:aminoglycoside 6'-N-acetyltransferase